MMPKKIILLSILLINTTLYAAENKNNNNTPASATESAPLSGSEPTKPLPIQAPMLAKESATEVKVIVEKNRTIEEYRHRGELIMVKVIPNKGKAYFIDPLENRQQGSAKELMDAGVKPVHWVIKEF